ncbi:MAG: AraC family transcriptional regulator [Anaerolineae bacterium]|nr:AraC family transcriptional regulator [Anaerolineae bacterium]
MANHQDHTVKFVRNARLNQLELRFSHYRRRVFDKHTHDTYSIGVVMAGQTAFFCRGRTEVIRQGEIALINPGEVHACNPQNGSALTYYMLYIEPDFIDDVASVLSEKNATADFVTPIIRDDGLHRRLTHMGRSLEKAQDDLEIETLLYETVAEVLQRYGNMETQKPMPRPGVDQLIANGRAYLMDHLFQNVTLDEMAAHSGLSTFHFLREFRKRYGLPPHSYQLQYRINIAKRLLAKGKPIAHVATDVGFADQSHFTRKFKAYVGTTPRRYQLADC